jgi:fructokinase
LTIQVISFGELLIDFVALERDVSVGYALRFEKAAGGAPANVAVGLARLGVPTAFITQLGDDPFGRYLEEVLRLKGVDTSSVVFSKEARTALAFVSIEASGERSFAFYRHPSADMLMTPDLLNRVLLRQASIFHFGSITLIDDPVRSTTLEAIREAKAGGALISYDPNLRAALWPSLDAAKTGMLQGLRQANLVKMNEEELLFLSGVGEMTGQGAIAEAACRLWHDELALMVITRGAEGCIAFTNGELVLEPGFRVSVEDTIGAGDGFVAGLLAGMLPHLQRGRLPELSLENLKPILRQANAVGALTVTRRGGIPALPDAEELRLFLVQ